MIDLPYVLSRLLFWDSSPSVSVTWTTHPDNPISSGGSTVTTSSLRDAITDAITNAWASTAFQGYLDSYLAPGGIPDPGAFLRFAPGDSATTLIGAATFGATPQYVTLIENQLTGLSYVNERGEFVVGDQDLTIVHELLHILLGQGDPPTLASPTTAAALQAFRDTLVDHNGPVIDAQNTIARQLNQGGDTQIGYHEFVANPSTYADARLGSIEFGKSYSDDRIISIVRLGDILGVVANDIIDHRSRSASDDLIFGFGGDDTLYGGLGNDHLYGGANASSSGGAGDRLFGGAGDDRLIGGEGADTLHGGEVGMAASADGRDRADYSVDTQAAPTTNGIDMAFSVLGGMAAVSLVDGYGSTDTLISIEEIRASQYEDTFTFDGVFNADLDLTIDAVVGARDVVDMSAAGNGYWAEVDAVGAGFVRARDAVSGTQTGGQVVFENLSAEVTGSGHADAFSVSIDGSIVNGGAGNDWVHTSGGTDELHGGAGSDRLVVDRADGVILDGGEGNDVIDARMAIGPRVASASQGVTVKFDDGRGRDVLLGRSTSEGYFKTGVTHIDLGVLSGGDYTFAVGSGRTDATGPWRFADGLTEPYFEATRNVYIVVGTATLCLGPHRVWEDQHGTPVLGFAGDDYNGYYALPITGIDPDLQFISGDGQHALADVLFPGLMSFAVPFSSTPVSDAAPSEGVTGGPRPGFTGGGSGGDAIDGGPGADNMAGDGGSDTLKGGGGKDRLFGDEGDDGLQGEAGDDDLFGGVGDDLLTGGAGNDRLFGGGDFDTAVMSAAAADFSFASMEQGGLAVSRVGETDTITDVDVVQFSDRSLTMIVGSEFFGVPQGSMSDDLIVVPLNMSTTIYGHEGSDILVGSDYSVTMFGGVGNDRLFGGAGNETLVGNENIFAQEADVLHGGGGDDLIYGEFTDTINGGAGTDSLIAINAFNFTLDMAAASIEYAVMDFGNDTIDASGQTVGVSVFASGGSDSVTGSAFNDLIFAGVGDDTVVGGAGADSLVGEAGADSLSGGDGDDTLYFDAQDSFVSGGGGSDVGYIQAGSGGGATVNMGASSLESISDLAGQNDTLLGSTLTQGFSAYAGGGADTVDGSGFADILWGEAGDDVMSGNTGADVMVGGAGSDRINGGAGNDALYGGASDGVRDTFVFQHAGAAEADAVYEFVTGSDKIDLSAFGSSFANVSISTAGGSSVVFLNGQQVCTVVGVTGLTAGDFVFTPGGAPADPGDWTKGDEALVQPGEPSKTLEWDGPITCHPTQDAAPLRPDLPSFDLGMIDLAIRPGDRGFGRTVVSDYDWIV